MGMQSASMPISEFLCCRLSKAKIMWPYHWLAGCPTDAQWAMPPQVGAASCPWRHQIYAYLPPTDVTIIGKIELLFCKLRQTALLQHDNFILTQNSDIPTIITSHNSLTMSIIIYALNSILVWLICILMHYNRCLYIQSLPTAWPIPLKRAVYCPWRHW